MMSLVGTIIAYTVTLLALSFLLLMILERISETISQIRFQKHTDYFVGTLVSYDRWLCNEFPDAAALSVELKDNFQRGVMGDPSAFREKLRRSKEGSRGEE